MESSGRVAVPLCAQFSDGGQMALMEMNLHCFLYVLAPNYGTRRNSFRQRTTFHLGIHALTHRDTPRGSCALLAIEWTSTVVLKRQGTSSGSGVCRWPLFSCLGHLAQLLSGQRGCIESHHAGPRMRWTPVVPSCPGIHVLRFPWLSKVLDSTKPVFTVCFSTCTWPVVNL